MKQLFANRCLPSLLFILFLFSGKAQSKDYTTASLHSHNDYKQQFPFKDAYRQGFGSIEVDIFLHNNQLLVAHEESELDVSKTLEGLYLQPLLEIIRTEKKVKQFVLLIDLKTDAIPTMQALISLLQLYPDITSNSRVQITITGNQPDPIQFNSYPTYIWFDANPDTYYPEVVCKRLAMMSANFKKYSKWNGKGVLTAEETKRLDSVVLKAGITVSKKIRFWNAPDIPNAWYQLMKLGVGFINTDLIYASASFMNNLPQYSYTLPKKQPTYTPTYFSDGKNQQPKNIILLIADGMGLAHLHAGYTANRGDLTIFKIKHTALSLTSSYDSYITDSAPGATAFSSGEKTNNRSVGVDHSGKPLKLLPAFMYQLKKPTAIITSGDITDATPASFFAHQSERTESMAILQDFFQSPIQILMGAGNKKIDSLLATKKAVTEIGHSLGEVAYTEQRKLVVTDSVASKPAADGRADWLQKAFVKATECFSSAKNGFMVMAEAAQVDYGGHANRLPYVVTEVLDFDLVVAEALRFADTNGETLVIITADHETGGLTLMDGDIKKGYVSGHFSTTDHTAIPVPVFAYGPRSNFFSGVFQNTAVFKKIVEVLEISK